MFPLLLLFSQYSRTPLYIASQKGHTGVVELLLQHNADRNISDEVSHLMMRLHVHVSAAINQCIMYIQYVVLCVLECFHYYYYSHRLMSPYCIQHHGRDTLV